ncbi:MAG: DEAD/DEAH box helicase [Deltaproteobacteria bacterium]|nr:DEAD/DEAH box helicase [Deltaproteobacteria bacterium]
MPDVLIAHGCAAAERLASPTPLLLLPNSYRTFYGAFPSLHSIQEQAIRPVLDGKDLIVQSATGSGKTEAVLAPVSERIICSGLKNSALYIVPTRALAFDISRRFESVLAERLGIRLAIRTGDIKRTGGGYPHIMITTPESLDVMLGSSNSDLRGFLLRVHTVIIDEVHPFIHQYRGRQLVYLLHRLSRRTGEQIQKIALSATIADPDAVIRFFHFKPGTVQLADEVKRRIYPRLVHLKDDEGELVTLLDDLYREWRYRKILIFANSRSRCDKIFELINQKGRFAGKAELHYSNLNARERQNVEQRFRKRNLSVCIATSTLELGIDVGDVDAVILFEPPDSVSAFLQRIGRANRRVHTIHFWGICHGERASGQLVRFLALLRLAGMGKVESPLTKILPSVLSQQVISCLYEKKRISPASLQELFQGQAAVEGSSLKDIMASLVKKKWLKMSKVKELYTGGRRYRDAFLNYRIWSNFPESEEEYRLEVSGEAVADIPKFIVRQIEPGDRVLLAGRRLKILLIHEGERKRVLAEPADGLDAKELYWLGKGGHVSFEVAQAMRDVLKSEEADENESAPGLFSRTRELIRQELIKEKKAVLLDNSIEVILTAQGFYRYRTYLGAIGNMILECGVREYMGKRTGDLYIVSDETGLVSSHLIRFERLVLPVSPEDFLKWAARHFKMLRAMFPLNSFCATLPKELILRELTSFIYDVRLIAFFKRYSCGSSEIIKGDPENLKFQSTPPEKKGISLLDPPFSRESLLTWEKNRRKPGTTFPLSENIENGRYRARPLTGTIIGEYFRLQKCGRMFCLHYLLPPEYQAERRSAEDEQRAQRLENGKEFERQVLATLKKQNEIIAIISEKDESGKIRPLQARFRETCSQLQQITGRKPFAGSRYLVHGVLKINALFSPSPTFFERQNEKRTAIDGVGIPDLIRVSYEQYERGKVIFEAGDIKSSSVPHYYQKWQVAFYAFLLKALIRSKMKLSQAKVADSGFLITRSTANGVPEYHSFDLKPYMTVFPFLLRALDQCLSKSPLTAFSQLKEHCPGCSFFDFCYQQALEKEDIQFLPRITAGGLEKITALGLKRIDKCLEGLISPAGMSLTVKTPPRRPGSKSSCFLVDDGWLNANLARQYWFSPWQREHLQAALGALHHNKIAVIKKKTRLYPANISTAFFLYLIRHPVSTELTGIGFAMRKQGQALKTFTWAAFSEENRHRAWREFSNSLLELWENAANNDHRPHIFIFGAGMWRKIREMAVQEEDIYVSELFRIGPEPHYTDLRQAFSDHFVLPIPGNMTLFALNRILGTADGLEIPDTLFHGDRLPDALISGTNNEQCKEYLATVLERMAIFQRWISLRLESRWNREDWRIIPENRSSIAEGYKRFIEAERSYGEMEMAILQELSLAERVERFRAMGPLRFIGTVLDDEGRFLYKFDIAKGAGLARFRRGDFLKLVPLGVDDLQGGIPVIIAQYEPSADQVVLHCRQSRNMRLHKNISYSLEEDGDDMNTSKLLHVVQTVFSPELNHPLAKMFKGQWDFDQPHCRHEWVEKWLCSEGAAAQLNPSQQHALKLPFRHALSLIQGPPGTGKTNLLGWILIALVRHAQATGSKLRIAVSALTHQAIDQVLSKVVDLVTSHNLKDFPARCVKLGRWDGPPFDEEKEGMQVEPLADAAEVSGASFLILGSTGYGLYNMFRSHNNTLPKPFDWVIFDEASQILVPQALLSLVYGKGNFICLGDIHQLPPVIRSTAIKDEQEEKEESSCSSCGPCADKPVDQQVRCSLLDILLGLYSNQSARLDVTYRMNAEICMFPSRTWYNSTLSPAPANAGARLVLKGERKNDLADEIIDPRKPVVLVLTDHRGCGQESAAEAGIIARLAHRLLSDPGMDKEKLAIITPHRAQNNAISRRLAELSGGEGDGLPLIDTVERIQGAERDVILFGFTCSDPDQVLSEFLNNPNRFNVAITRARKKLIVVGSLTFFSAIPRTEQELRDNACFKAFWEHCRKHDCCFDIASDGKN